MSSIFESLVFLESNFQKDRLVRREALGRKLDWAIPFLDSIAPEDRYLAEGFAAVVEKISDEYLSLCNK